MWVRTDDDGHAVSVRSLRVLHVSQPTTAGVAVCVAQLAKHQRSEGIDARIACPPEGDLVEWAARDGVPAISWSAERAPSLGLLDEIDRLQAIVDAVDPDVVYLHSAKAGLAGRLALRGTRPTVFHPNGWSFKPTGGQRAFARTWERFAARWTDLFVMASEREAFEGRTARVPGRLVIVPNGVDVKRYPAQDDLARRRARVRLGLDAPRIAVCVGRLCEQKGQDILVDLWPEVVRAVPRAALVLVGDGPWRGRLEATAPSGVHFAGFHEDVRPWLAAADVIVQPSRWEGLSFATLEALSSARPVVAFDVEGMSEAIGSVAGAVVSSGDRHQLAHEVARRLLDPARAADEGRAGRQRVEARFTEQRFASAVSREVHALAEGIGFRTPYEAGDRAG